MAMPTDDIMLEYNKALARRANEMWASGNVDVVEDIFAADYVNHQESDVAGGISDRDLASWKALVAGHHAAFSNARTRVLMQIAEGDMVATRWEFTVTHTGDYLGHEPTGRTVSWTGVQIDRIEDGRISESWVNWDKYRQFDALKLIGQ